MRETQYILSQTRQSLKDYKHRLEEIDRRLESFPAHLRSIIIKELSGRQYYYEQWREGRNVHSRYLGPVLPGAAAQAEREILEHQELLRSRTELKRLITYYEKLTGVIEKDQQKEKLIDNYRFEVFWKDRIVSRVTVTGKDAHISRYTMHPAHQLFASSRMSRHQINQIFEMRCWDRNRPDILQLLAGIGLTEYNPRQIVRRTHGVTWNDYLWFRFPGEALTDRDVLIR